MVKVTIPISELKKARKGMKEAMNNILENKEKYPLQETYDKTEEGIKQIEEQFGVRRTIIKTDDEFNRQL